MTVQLVADFSSLIAEAHGLARPIKPSAKCEAGTVAALIVSESGRHYTGVCVEFRCGMGFCAEHAAVAEMLKHHETRIAYVVAVHHTGRVQAPSASCAQPTNSTAIRGQALIQGGGYLAGRHLATASPTGAARRV